MTTSFESKIDRVVIALLIVFALWQNSLSLFYLSPIGDVTLFRTFLPIAFIYFSVRKVGAIKKTKIISYTVWLFASMLILGCVSLSWAHNLSQSVSYLFNLTLMAILIFVVYLFVETKDDFNFLCQWLTINLFVFLLLGVYESVSGNSVTDILIRENEYKLYSPTVNFTNMNDFASLIIILMPLSCVCIYKLSCNKALKWCLMSVLVVLGLYNILMASAKLIFLIFVAYFVLLLLYKKRFALFGAVCVLGLIFVAATSHSGGIVESILENLSSDNIRIEIIRVNIEGMARNNLFWGMGAGSTLSRIPGFDYSNCRGISNPHNFFIEVFTEYGLVIFCVLLLWWCANIVCAFKNFKFMSGNELKYFEKQKFNKFRFDYDYAVLAILILFPVIGMASSSITLNPAIILALAMVLVYNSLIYGERNGKNNRYRRIFQPR